MKEGRGSPHGGVFLELQTFAEWFGKKSKKFNAAEHWKKKLPSMYHQFKELGGLDITKEPMEVGPTTHYVMGGVRVDADTQMSPHPGPVRVRRMCRGHQRREPARRQLALGPARPRQAGRRVRGEVREGQPRRARIHDDQVDAAAKWALEPFERAGDEGPFKVQHDLQDMMQDLVGIVRKEDEMVRALEGLEKLQCPRGEGARSPGNREYNPGWHTAMDLHNLLTVSEAVTRAAILRKESRGAQFRDDYPKKDNDEVRQGELDHRERPRRLDADSPGADSADAGRVERSDQGRSGRHVAG